MTRLFPTRRQQTTFAFALRERVDALIEWAMDHGLRVRQLRVSKREAERLYPHIRSGRYRDIPLRLVGRDVWT